MKMNRIAISSFIAACVLYASPLSGGCIENNLEIRGAPFYHSSKLFRHIYGQVSACWGIEANIKVRDRIAVFADFDWFGKHGRSEGLHDSTRIGIANLSVGVKYFFPFWCTTAYVGIGPSLGGVWIKNRPHCHCENKERTSKTVFGGVIKVGTYYFLTPCIFIDSYIDYLYQPVHFEHHVDLGGWKPGFGIGMTF